MKVSQNLSLLAQLSQASYGDLRTAHGQENLIKDLSREGGSGFRLFLPDLALPLLLVFSTRSNETALRSFQPLK